MASSRGKATAAGAKFHADLIFATRLALVLVMLAVTSLAARAADSALSQLDQQCLACHSANGSQLVGPTFQGLYGSEQTFEDGSTAIVDEAYIHESIIDPMAKITKGYPPSMPPFSGMLTEEQIKDITEYIKSLQ